MDHKQLWAKAQTLDCRERWDLESVAIDAFLLTRPQEERAQLEKLGPSALCHLAECGDAPGWAFACGYTVHWSPTRGAAKRQWYSCRNYLKGEDYPGLEALGRKPEPTSLLEAYVWGRGSIS